MFDALGFYAGTTPWALPVLAIATVGLALSARRIAARTGWPPWLTLSFGMSLAGFLGVTATPGSGAGFNVSDGRGASWSYHVPPLHELAQITDPWQTSEPALNAWLAMPLGFMAVVAEVTMRSAWPMLIAVVAPFAAEGVQWAFPGFGRAAFLFGDVTANWCGVVVGGVVALVALGVRTGLRRLASRRRAVAPTPTVAEVLHRAAKRDGGATTADIVEVIRRARDA